MTSTWAKMPCNWQQQQDIHKSLRDAPVGESIAALKLYLAFCMLANFNPSAAFPCAGSVKLSLVSLAKKVGMTKPLAIKGVRLLEGLKLIRRKIGKPTTYILVDYDTCNRWTKLPKRHLIGSDSREIERLATLPNRGHEIFEALQLYIYIASIRDKITYKARVSYSKITSILHMSRNAVSRAITILSAKDLVSVRRDEPTEGQHPVNVYWLLGRVDEAAKPA